MCGIAGILSPGPWSEPLGDTVRRMGMALRHRGPDGFGTWTDEEERVALAHTRLSVIDLAGGAQPMGCGPVQVVFNGEIYNYRSLRSRLEGRGHTFRSESDTEVLLHGYREWGRNVVYQLDGMFAFAVWDGIRRRLVLARDPAGMKPLYWSTDGRAFWFASEIKGLLAGGVSDALRPEALPSYLTYGYVPRPATFYRAVEQLEPGTVAQVGSDLELRTCRFWAQEFRSGHMTESEAVQGVRDRLESAVEKRLVSDVPLGAFLSGGVDSTVVVGLMSRMSQVPVRTFSIGFADDARYDETHYARLAAKAFGTEHTEFRVRADSEGLVDDLVRAYDQPFGDSSAIPTYIVSRLARADVTVALTGDGGDELFAGYLRLHWARVAERLPGWTSGLGGSLLGLLPRSGDFRSLRRRAGRFLEACALTPDERMLRWIGFFPSQLEELLRPNVGLAVDRDGLLESFRSPLARAAGRSPLSRSLQLNFETYLHDDLLVKADRCSMAAGLEVRCPFLDKDLMTFAAAMPDRFRAPRGRLKWILKQAFRDLIPEEILRRRKMGFGVPLPTWFRGPWRPMLEDRILGPDCTLWDWINPDPVRAMAKEHLAGAADHGHRLWALLTLERWLALRAGPVPSQAPVAVEA